MQGHCGSYRELKCFKEIGRMSRNNCRIWQCLARVRDSWYWNLLMVPFLPSFLYLGRRLFPIIEGPINQFSRRGLLRGLRNCILIWLINPCLFWLAYNKLISQIINKSWKSSRLTCKSTLSANFPKSAKWRWSQQATRSWANKKTSNK